MWAKPRNVKPGGTLGMKGLIYCIDRDKKIAWESFTFLRGLHLGPLLASRALLEHSACSMLLSTHQTVNPPG